jgi:hypothetical protein
MQQDVRRLWPDAPVVEQARSGRWVRFVMPDDGSVVYLQKRTWDSATRPDYLVVWHGGDDERPVAQRHYHDLDGAVEAVRSYYRTRMAMDLAPIA